MEDEFIKYVLGKGLDQYEKTLRWTFIAVIALLIFHFIFFSPFLKADKKLAKVEKRLNSLSGIEQAVEGLSGDLTSLSNTAAEKLSKQLSYTFDALRSDFKDLSELVNRIRKGGEIRLSDTIGDSDRGQFETSGTLEPRIDNRQFFPENIPEPENPNMMIQETLDSNSQHMRHESAGPEINLPPEQRFAFNRNLVDEVRNAGSIDSLTSILLPTIEEKIIAPRFSALNRKWGAEILPEMQKQSNIIRQRLKVAEQTDTSEEAPWQSILATLESIMKSAESMKFSPPEKRFWWMTVQGKGEVLDEIDIEVRGELDKTVNMKAVTDDLTRTITEQQNAEISLKNELERITKSFDKFIEQQAVQLAGLPQQLGGIPIDLVTMVSRFPIMLGMVLAVFMVWQANCLKRLIGAVEMVREHDKSNLYAAWIIKRIKGEGRNRRGRLIYSIGIAVLMLLWIGVASYELRGWPLVSFSEVIILFIISGVLLMSGFIYRWRIYERILTSVE